MEALWGDSPSFGGPTDSPLTFSPGIHKWPCVGEQGGAGEGFTGQYTVSLHFQSQGSASTHLCLFPSPVSDLGSAETTHISLSLPCLRQGCGAEIDISAPVHWKVIWEPHLLFTSTFQTILASIPCLSQPF